MSPLYYCIAIIVIGWLCLLIGFVAGRSDRKPVPVITLTPVIPIDIDVPAVRRKGGDGWVS